MNSTFRLYIISPVIAIMFMIMFAPTSVRANSYSWVDKEFNLTEVALKDAAYRLKIRDLTTELLDAYRFERYNEIPDLIDQLESLAPMSSEFAYFVALENYLKGEKAVSTVYLKQSLERNDRFDPSWNLLGLIHKEAGNLSEAKSAFEKAHQASQYNPTYIYNIGTVYFSQNDLAQAKSHALLAIEYKSNFSDAYYLLGLVYSREKNSKESLENYKKAFDTGLFDPIFFKDYLQESFLAGEDSTTIMLANRLENETSPSVLRLLGAVRLHYGEFKRAEFYYRALIDIREASTEDLKSYIYSIHRSGGSARIALRNLKISDEERKILEDSVTALEKSPTDPGARDRIVNPAR